MPGKIRESCLYSWTLLSIRESSNRRFCGCDCLPHDLIANSKVPLPPEFPHQNPYVFRVSLQTKPCEQSQGSIKSWALPQTNPPSLPLIHEKKLSALFLSLD